MTRRELIDFCLTFPDAYEDYPFGGDAHSDGGSWAVMRRRSNKKGFAHIYGQNGDLRVNLKCDPLEADFLRRAFRDVTPAYHMNKIHWNGVSVNGDVPEDELKRMIEKSYGLVKRKSKKR
ncbi:MAG: MmcQ/YjbR family DNA-binding protein [Oscillospiraceae bacterium]|jgi:predicted DNA-binding protein (MmcQ/YjbR family)|nr:MmcQ/YjbR family DNA-binding protein [Oscillospiraceae bacterium]